MNESPSSAYKRLTETFQSGKTKPLQYRLSQLDALRKYVIAHEADVYAALYADMRQPMYEVFLSTLTPVHTELDHMIRNLSRLVKPTTLSWGLQGVLKSIPEPKGAVAILAPSNFPLMLALRPLAAAIAAGNCVVLKPSEFSVGSEKFLMGLREVLDSEAFAVVIGGADVAKELVSQPWAHIMFTGSSAVGKHIMAAAAKNLTPVTLELGGKCPAVIAADADISFAATSVVFSRFFNTGQLCLSTDYCLVEESVYDEFVRLVISETKSSFSDNPQESPSFGRLMAKQFDHVQNLLNETKGRILLGGNTDKRDLYVSPTIVEADINDVLMEDEIFGPILPIIRVKSVDDAVHEIKRRPAPLGLYIFTENLTVAESVLEQTQSGCACVNDSALQYFAKNTFLAGFGNSGLGGGVGSDEGFYTFSHRRVVLFSRPILSRMMRMVTTPDIVKHSSGRQAILAASGVGLSGRFVPTIGAFVSFLVCTAQDIGMSVNKLIRGRSA